jgi:hypothetical protein
MRFPVFEARKAAAFRVNEGPIMKTRGTKPPAGKKQGAAKRKRQSLAGLMPLEPRVMYDAAGAHTAASHMVLDPHHNDPGHVTSTTNSSQAGAPTHAADAGLVKPVSPPPAPAFLPPTPNQSGDGIFFSGVTNTAVGANNPVVIDSGISITSAGDNQFKEVIVQVTNNGLATDVLAFNNGFNAGGLAGSTTNNEIFADGGRITATFFSGGTGVNGVELDLTGTASLTDYTTALQQVTFSSTVNDPTAGGTATTRNVGFQFVDTNNVASNVATTHLDTKAGTSPPPPPPATPPTVAAGATATFAENGGLAILDLGLTVNDPAGTSLKAAKITISGAISADQLGFLGGVNTQHFSATGDTLTATSSGFNAATNTYTFVITGTGTAAEYQTVLREVDYGVSPNPGTDPTVGGTNTQRSVSWSLSTDGTTFGTAATSTISWNHGRRFHRLCDRRRDRLALRPAVLLEREDRSPAGLLPGQ